MIGLLLKAVPLWGKVLAVWILVAGVMWSIRLYGNRRATEAANEERAKVYVETARQVEETTAKKTAEIEQLQKNLSDERLKRAEVTEELQTLLEAMRSDLSRKLTQIAAKRVTDDARIDAIPGDELDGELRLQSSAVASAEREYPAGSAPPPD